jgi:chlorophyllide a reductase subunit Y
MMEKQSLTLINARGGEVRYDGAAEAKLDNTEPPATPVESGVAAEAPGAAPAEGGGCHAGAEKMKAQAQAAGNRRAPGKVREGLSHGAARPAAIHVPGLRLAARGPAHEAHGDHPVGLGLLRVRPDLHLAFYGARRTVGYVPFNSETLVTGKLFEDIRDAVHDIADPDKYDAVVITNLCVPTASGVPLRMLPKEINGVRIIGIDVPGFGVPTHAEAKDVLAGAMLNMPAPKPSWARSRRPTASATTARR